MVHMTIGPVEFQLKEAHDFSWLRALGDPFCVFSQNDSGNISFGVQKGNDRYFVKAAGLKTAESVRTPEEAVAALKGAMPVYEAIAHPNLIKLVRHYAQDNLYIAVFRWADGDCLFDHWNFSTYQEHPEILPPAERFKRLPVEKRLKAADVLFSFLSAVLNSGYVAVDFYDGSLIYDFAADTMTICDIDYFRRKPAFNDIGQDYFGSKRVKAPEEYRYGARIDDATTVFTLGALLFGFFGNFTAAQTRRSYKACAFSPCAFSQWEGNRACYEAARKAVLPQREKRFATIDAFRAAWNAALRAG